MSWLFPYVLFLHVMGAILAFGPTYAFAIIGAMGAKEPQHASYGSRLIAAINSKMVYPLVVIQGITGLALIGIGQIPLMSRPWLLVATLIYLVALAYSFTIQRSALHHVIELTSGPPPAGAPQGPPAGLRETVVAIQRGSIFLGLAVLVIVFLMVVKPGA